MRRPFERGPEDLRFAVAVMGGAELLRSSPYADAWSFDRVISLISDAGRSGDPDRTELLELMQIARRLGGSQRNRISTR